MISSKLLRTLTVAVVCLGVVTAVMTFSRFAEGAPAANQADAVDSRSPATTRDASPASAAPAAAAPAPEAGAVTVDVVTLESTPIAESVATTGELRANEEVDLRAEVDGRLVGLHFDEGKAVRRGELLVKIHDADLQAELRRVEVERGLVQLREQRSRKLLDEATISQAVYDEAKGELDVLDARIASIHARIAKTEIRAPFSGVIGLRSVSEGSYLTSSTPIARLQSLDPIKLDFAVAEKYSGAVRRGDSVDFTLAGSDRPFTGTVYAIEPRIDPETRTVRVRARAANPDGRLLPGAFAEIRLVLNEEPALMVPAIALIPGLESTTVYVVEDGRAAVRPVRLGQRTAGSVQVVEGLQAGDQVIVRGIQQVRPGTPVAARQVSQP